jgi:ribosome-associated translation inhibitor RaiA
MQIQINTDNHIENHAGLVTYVQGLVESALGHVGEHVTRVEVHIKDENGHKSGPGDKSCVMEAHVEGKPPIAVRHHAETVDQVIHGAMDKLYTVLEKNLERQRETRRHATDAILPGEVLPKAI